MHKRIPCILLALVTLLLPLAAHALTREELRTVYSAITAQRTDETPYAVEPDIAGFTAGELRQEKLSNALDMLNFIRSLAGAGAVELSPLYNLRCQNAALLLASGGAVSHSPAQPADMHDDLYQSALMGAQGSNLAVLNWMGPDILTDAVEYFARDDGEENLSSLGHRRWLLSPAMAETGFGLANARDGSGCIAMYAVDDGNARAPWEYVAWPCGGVFPVELMRQELAWSLSLNVAAYDLSASRPIVTLMEENSGARFSFDLTSRMGDGYCMPDPTPIGGGSCIIFRPNLVQAGIDEYVQNQIWHVRVTGLKRTDGSPAEIAYSCEMVSLYPQDAVNVELSCTEACLTVGQSLQLTAQVIPGYADDLSLRWYSDDGSVAMVTANGKVNALGEGSCRIIAESANGRQDACAITVSTP